MALSQRQYWGLKRLLQQHTGYAVGVGEKLGSAGLALPLSVSGNLLLTTAKQLGNNYPIEEKSKGHFGPCSNIAKPIEEKITNGKTYHKSTTAEKSGQNVPSKSVLPTIDKTENILPVIGKRFDFADIDTLGEMTIALDDFKCQYEPLQRRANQEARRIYSDPHKQTKRQARIDYILHGPSPKWKVWRECHKEMKVLENKYSEPIHYFAAKPKIRKRAVPN